MAYLTAQHGSSPWSLLELAGEKPEKINHVDALVQQHPAAG